MKQILTITDTFNDVFTNYEDKISTLTMEIDLEKDCECDEYRKCGLCKLVERYSISNSFPAAQPPQFNPPNKYGVYKRNDSFDM